MTFDIGFLVFPGFQILDLTGPMSAFNMAGRLAGTQPYRLRAVSAPGGIIASSSGLEVVTEAIGTARFDTFIVVGGACHPPNPIRHLADVAHQQAQSAGRIASVCSGAFILADAGLLDGRSATTHWRHAAELQRLYPKIRVDGDRIYTKDGPVWTSAGITSGVDLALAMIEEDLGLQASRATAQMLVVYHRRPGGQSQFSALLDLDARSDRIRDVLGFMRTNLHEGLNVARLAEIACLSPRQFARAFRMETGETPAKAIERLRAEAAKLRIEAGREPIEDIARHVGFADPERMRRAFLRLFGQPPQGIRRIARATGNECVAPRQVLPRRRAGRSMPLGERVHE